jgi:molecular chaperone DnaK (HSP70)
VVVVEGENGRPEACITLGECVVRDLPPGLPKNTAVEVEYAYGADGRISVSARVPSIRYSRRVEIQRNAGRDLNDLNAWRTRLCKGSALPLRQE